MLSELFGLEKLFYSYYTLWKNQLKFVLCIFIPSSHREGRYLKFMLIENVCLTGRRSLADPTNCINSELALTSI